MLGRLLSWTGYNEKRVRGVQLKLKNLKSQTNICDASKPFVSTLRFDVSRWRGLASASEWI